MSSHSTPSPQQRPSQQPDETPLPAGHCRYILLQPEIKGQRCGCAHFNLNRSTPGTICECGHLACYHVSNGEPPSGSENQEMAQMKHRLEQLEREHVELHQICHRFMILQERIGQDHDRNEETILRISRLEDAFEKNQSEVGHEVREAYRNLGRAWDSISELTQDKKRTEGRLRHIDERLHNVDAEVNSINERHYDLSDIVITLEERVDNQEDRVEALELAEGIDAPMARGSTTQDNAVTPTPSASLHSRSRTIAQRPANTAQQLPRSRSQSPAFTLDPTPKPTMHVSVAPDSDCEAAASPVSVVAAPPSAAPPAPPANDRGGSSPRPISMPQQMPMPAQGPTSAPPPAVMALRTAAQSSSSGNPSPHDLWTVHVSLLPTSTQPFPFERDTVAYKRCLSRGLHQMIAVNGTSAAAFEEAINNAFGRILRGRKWVPFQALPCTAERLAGLPMLRPLDEALLDEPFDLDFLRNHCAVCDSNGKVDSLYIAMRDKTLSWHSIRRLPVFLQALEPCWSFDTLLDANTPFPNDDYDNDVSSSEDEIMGGMPRPPAGDIVATLPSLKRAASEMSRSSSFGSATATTPAVASVTTAAEGEGSRPKVQRIYPLPNIVEARRSVRTS